MATWALVDRTVLHTKVLEEREIRKASNDALVKQKIREALDKAQAGNKAQDGRFGRLILGSPSLCGESDCQFSLDLSHCLVCSHPQSKSFMAKWYAFHARRLSREENLKIRFQSCTFPLGATHVKGRLTRALFTISPLPRRPFAASDFSSEDEDALLPPLPRRYLRPSKPPKSRTCAVM
jgi:hypothetical protein